MNIEELEQFVMAFTSRLDKIDGVLKKRGLGANMIPVFRCGASGLYFPHDYVKEWGKKYGIGLGPHPVSETLQTEYEIPPTVTKETQSVEEIMHPLLVCQCQVDWDLVDESEAETKWAIPAEGDQKMLKRVPILRAKQLANPRGKLRIYQAEFARVNNVERGF